MLEGVVEGVVKEWSDKGNGCGDEGVEW